MITLDEIRNKPQIYRVLTLCLCMAASCLLGAAQYNGMRLPLPHALAAALPPLYSLAVLAGGVLAYFLTGSNAELPLLICTLVLTVLLRWMFGERDKPSLAALIVSGGIASVVGIFGLAGLVRGADWLVWLFYTACAVGFALSAANLRKRCRNGFPLRLCGTDALYASVCYVVMLAAICAARIYLISVGEMLSGLLLLLAAKRYRAIGGVLCGTLNACAFLLVDADRAGMAAMLPLAGLVVGYCVSWHKSAVFCLYSSICGIGTMLSGQGAAAALTFVNFLIGGILYLFLPAAELADALLQIHDQEAGIAALAGAKMEFMSQSIAGVRGSAERIANMLTRGEPQGRVADRVCETVCGKCRSRSTCWESAQADTGACFQRMEQAGLSEPLESPEGCLRPERVTEEFMRAKRQNAAARTLAARLRDAQGMLFTQMRVTEALLSRAGHQLQRQYSNESTRFVTETLERFGVPLRAAAVSVSEHQRMTIELYIPAHFTPDLQAITECLSDALHRPLLCNGLDTAGDEHRLVLHSKGNYMIVTAAAQCAVSEEEPCGDGWVRFTDSEGYEYLVLSDGMGTGRHAAVDARIVLTNFRQLVQSGMDCAEAARMVNAIMLTKSGEERFATLDVAKICTDTAAVTLYKYGAGPTFIKHGERITLCQAATVPIGILPKAEPYTTVLKLAPGDMLFMLSDGLDDSLYPYIRQRLAQGGDLQELAHSVCAKAQRDAMGIPKDDVTVLAAMIAGKEQETT